MKTTYSPSNPARGTKITVLLAIAISLALAAPGRAASPSELLEQGIYEEETKGDLDAALQLYKQAVSEAKTSRAVASQAQFRVGVCYYKKKDSTAAMAAFEQLVTDFPEQQELAARAGDYLFRALPLRPAPWVDGEELRFDLKTAGGLKCGSVTTTVNAGETNGQKLWLLGVHSLVGLTSESFIRAEVEAQTLRPLRSRWQGNWDRHIDTLYVRNGAEMRVRGAAEAKHAQLPGAVYDDYEIFQLIRRLPLATNYSVSLFSGDLNASSGDRSRVAYKLRVVGIEKVQVPAGTYECFKVEVSPNITYWYSTDSHRYAVKFAENGAAVVGELAAINLCRAGEPVRYQAPEFGFCLTAPADWVFDRYPGGQTKALMDLATQAGVLNADQARLLSALRDNPRSELSLRLLNPGLRSYCEADLGRLEDLGEKARPSPRAWAEEDIARATNVLTDLRVRTNGWQVLTVAGQPAVTAIGSYGQGDYKMTAYGVWIFDNTNALKYYFVTAPKDFEGLRPTFDALVGSYTHSR